MIPVTGSIVGQNVVIPIYFMVGETYALGVPAFNQAQIIYFTDLSNANYPAVLGQKGIIVPGYFQPSVTFYFTFSGTEVTVIPVNSIVTPQAALIQLLGSYQSSLLAASTSGGAGDIMVPASQMIKRYFVNSATQTGEFTITTDTAENILAVTPNSPVGSSFVFRFINNDQSSPGYSGTLVGGSGVTIGTTPSNPKVGQGNWVDYIFTFTQVGISPALDALAVGGSSLGLL